MAAGRIGHREVTVHVGLAEEAADCFGSAEPARSRLRAAHATPWPGPGRHAGTRAYGPWHWRELCHPTPTCCRTGDQAKSYLTRAGDRGASCFVLPLRTL